ncbi:MAG: hypothetical protein R2795_21770 [Saprospiraceae bacterium]
MKQSIEAHIPFREVRPRFEVHSPKTIEELTVILKEALSKEGVPCRGQVNPGFVTIYTHDEHEHFWAPRLTVTMEREENGTLIRGLYGPRPAVWTMFIFFYAILGFAIMVIAIIGSSNHSLGIPSNILWWIPVLVLVFLSLYVVAYIGKKMSYGQMVTICHFWEESTELHLG